MSRRRFLKESALGGLALLASPLLNFGRGRLIAEEPLQVSTRAVDLVLGGPVIDMLSLVTLDWRRLFRWQREPGAFGEADFRLLQESGVGLFHPAVETGASDPYQGALSWIGGWERLFASAGCFLARITAIDELPPVARRGQLGVLIGFQNSTHFRTLADVASFYELGQRVSQLTYNERNRLGSGCLDRRDGGLTPFGSAVVAEMNRLGMAIDVSHCGERTSREAIAASRRPVLVTHSNCRALVPSQPRCKSDAILRQLAAGGGVIGLTVVRAFVSAKRGATLEQLLDHFDHAIRVAGIDHVGLGSDVDVTALDPATGRINPLYSIAGLHPQGRVFQIADGLLRRGYTPQAVELVLGGNFRRALGAIQVAPQTKIPDAGRDPFCPPAKRRRPKIAPPPSANPGLRPGL